MQEMQSQHDVQTDGEANADSGADPANLSLTPSQTGYPDMNALAQHEKQMTEQKLDIVAAHAKTIHDALMKANEKFNKSIASKQVKK